MSEDMNEGATTYTCQNCGGGMVFNISLQIMQCPYCDSAEEMPQGTVREFDFQLSDAGREKAAIRRWDAAVTMLRCESCSAEILVPQGVTALKCEFCGSARILEQRQQAGIPPEALVPFTIDRHKALELFSKWIRRQWLAPGTLKHQYQEEEFHAVYLPYWTFDAHANARYTGEGGKDYTVTVGSGKNKRTETRTRWYRVSGNISCFFDDVIVNAQKNKVAMTAQVEDYNPEMLKPFSTQYLSGFMTEKYSVTPQEAHPTAQAEMIAELELLAKKEIRQYYDRMRGVRVQAAFSNWKYKHILLPMWMSAFIYGGKRYQIVINGHSGRLHGTYPKSAVKVALVCAVCVAVMLLLLLFLSNY